MLPVTDLGRAHAAIRPELDAAVARVLDRNWYILGPEVEAFETAFAAYCGVAHAVGCASGTDALSLTLRALGLGPGDEVITTALTAAATAGAILAVGATPVFADCDPPTRNLDPKHVEALVTPRTRALLPVHLYGRPAELDSLGTIAARHGLALVEDAAQAHGARWRGRPAGSIGLAGCFSFYPTKNLGALGDGGAVVTNDGALAERLRRLRNHGQSSRYHHIEQSGNSRLDELQAALLSVKLRHLDGWNAERRAQATRYLAQLKGAPFGLPPANDETATSCWHLFVIESAEREALRGRLAAAGVGTDIHYPTPLHLQPAYAAYGSGPGSLPVAERLADTIVSLPLFPGLTAEEQATVVAQLCGWPAAAASR